MLSAKTNQLIDRTDGSQQLVMIFTLNLSAELAAVAKISDRSARSRAMDQAIWNAKQPLVELLERYKSHGLQILNELDSSPALIASGPAQGWKRLLLDNRSLATNPKLTLEPNQPIWGIA